MLLCAGCQSEERSPSRARGSARQRGEQHWPVPQPFSTAGAIAGAAAAGLQRGMATGAAGNLAMDDSSRGGHTSTGMTWSPARLSYFPRPSSLRIMPAGQTHSVRLPL